MAAKKSGRRKFLQGGAALVGMAAAGALAPAQDAHDHGDAILPSGVRKSGELSPFEKSYRVGSPGEGLTPLQDSQGMITPSALHFYVNHEYGAIPVIDPDKYRLIIHGMVDRPVVLTLNELKRLPSVSRIHFLECNGNSNPERIMAGKTVQQAHGRTSSAEWTGVMLSLLLKEVGAQKAGTWVIVGSEDTANHAISLPMEKALDDVIIAYGMNGESLRLENGYPVRMVVPGWGGRIHVKWLKQLKVTDQPYMTTQDRASEMTHSPAGEGAFLVLSELGRRYQYETYPKSIITYPSGMHKLAGSGPYEITGLAWSGAGKVKRVEVSTDNGKTWRDAALQEPILPKAHTRFRMPWNWNGEETVIQSRCTDEFGDVQPSSHDIAKNWTDDKSAACISAIGDACRKTPRRANRALIQPWRVARDGNVSNAFVMTDEVKKIG